MKEHAAGKALLCTMMVEGQRFGIDTRQVREVLGECSVQRVPLSPDYVAGIVTYRGEVLTTVSLRVVLGLDRAKKNEGSCVVVLDGEGNRSGPAEHFGLQVDGLGSVAPFGEDLLRGNPPTLSAGYTAVCCGAYRVAGGVIVQLDPERLKPVFLAKRWAQREQFGSESETMLTRKRERPECER